MRRTEEDARSGQLSKHVEATEPFGDPVPTRSPARSAGLRDSTTCPIAPARITSPTGCGGT
jgi:hypothetical protein